LRRSKKADGYIAAIHLVLFVSIVAWTQTKSVTPVQVKKKTPAITFLRFSGTNTMTKLSRSQMPSPPPTLTRSERVNVIALARKTGNIQAKSLSAEPRPTIVLTPGAPVSGPNSFEIYLGCLFATTEPGTGRSTQCATLSGESDSLFHFRLAVVPGKTYLADFFVSPGPWMISGGGAEAEIDSDSYHLFVGFRAEHQTHLITLRRPNNNRGVLATLGPAFFRLELTRID
jgi:hypothetical protein